MNLTTVPGWLGVLGHLACLSGFVGLTLLGRSWGWGPGEFVFAGFGSMLVLGLIYRRGIQRMFGPVFWYEAMRLGRRRSTFILRLLYILAVVSLLALLYLGWLNRMESGWSYAEKIPPSKLSEFANEFFEIFIIVQLAVAAFLTPAYVAGTIADEKERKTLEFLLATDLRNEEIVFGKFAARFLTLIMYVLAGLPVLAFLQLFGGIDPELVMMSTAVSVITVVGLSALSLLMSVICRKPRDAIALTYVIAFMYVILSFVIAAYLRYALSRKGVPTTDILFGYTIDWADVAEVFASGNILYVFPTGTRGGMNLDPALLSRMLMDFALFWAVASALLLGVAVTRLRAIALAQSYGQPQKASKSKIRARPAIGNDPFLWREVFVGSTRKAGFFTWVFRFIVALFLVSIPLYMAWDVFFGDRYGFRSTFADHVKEYQDEVNGWLRVMTGLISVIIFFGAALRGATTIAGERDRDTWISLMSTPATAWEILSGKWFGCFLSMRLALGVLFAIWSFGLIIGAVNFFMILVTLFHLIVYTSAYSWAGLFCSTTASTSLAASIRTFFVCIFMSIGFWLLPICCCCLPSQALLSYSARGDFPVYSVLFAFTPPYMMGYLPLPDLSDSSLGIFGDLNGYNHVGIIPPAISLLLWISLSMFFGGRTYRRFVRLLNRQQIKRRPIPRNRKAEANLDDDDD